ncbi:DNA-binding transcriptional regulator [Escherichia coli]|nr:DNA-binding transcriptional regulator [Escherichia coli]
MDDCGAILHNIETKWLYDFLTLEKCRNFSPGGSQSQRLATGIQPPHPCAGTGDWC